MTLLGAIDLRSRILFAADNLVTDGTPAEELPIVTTTQKLWRPENMPTVVWGFVGLQPVGNEFRDWLQPHDAFASWSALTDAAADALAPMNGKAKRRADDAGVKDFEGCEVLIGGYLGGQGALMVLDWEGGVRPAENNPMFMGFGHSPAYVGWFVLDRAGNTGDREAAFRLAMDTATDLIRDLGGPVSYLDATPEGSQ